MVPIQSGDARFDSEKEGDLGKKKKLRLRGAVGDPTGWLFLLDLCLK